MKKLNQFCQKHHKLMKGTALAGVVLVALWGGACLSCHGGKTMVIDFNRAQQEANAYKTIIAEQTKYMEALRAEWSVELQSIQKEDQELGAQRKKLADADFKNKVAALQAKLNALQQRYHEREQQVTAATQLSLEKIKENVKGAIQKAAKKECAGIVLDKAGALYVADKNDMTDTFVDMMNKYVDKVEYPNPATINLKVGR